MNDIEKTMKRAFWDILHSDFTSNPPKYDHFIILVNEVKDRLIRIRPRNKKAINDVLDTEFLKQRLEHQVADPQYIASLVLFICEQITKCCAPADDELAKEWCEKCQVKLQNVDPKLFIPDFFEWFLDTTHEWLNHIDQGIRDFIKKIENSNNKK